MKRRHCVGCFHSLLLRCLVRHGEGGEQGQVNLKEKEEKVALHKELLAILVCPMCKGALTPVDEEAGLYCPACSVVFPIREEIPVMLPEEAIALSEWKSGRRQTLPRSDSKHP